MKRFNCCKRTLFSFLYWLKSLMATLRPFQGLWVGHEICNCGLEVSVFVRSFSLVTLVSVSFFGFFFCQFITVFLKFGYHSFPCLKHSFVHLVWVADLTFRSPCILSQSITTSGIGVSALSHLDGQVFTCAVSLFKCLFQHNRAQNWDRGIKTFGQVVCMRSPIFLQSVEFPHTWQ